jgi:hypothetical protein
MSSSSGMLSTPEQWWCRLTVEEYHTYCTRNGYDVPIPTMSTTTASSFLAQPPAQVMQTSNKCNEIETLDSIIVNELDVSHHDAINSADLLIAGEWGDVHEDCNDDTKWGGNIDLIDNASSGIHELLESLMMDEVTITFSNDDNDDVWGDMTTTDMFLMTPSTVVASINASPSKYYMTPTAIPKLSCKTSLSKYYKKSTAIPTLESKKITIGNPVILTPYGAPVRNNHTTVEPTAYPNVIPNAIMPSKTSSKTASVSQRTVKDTQSLIRKHSKFKARLEQDFVTSSWKLAHWLLRSLLIWSVNYQDLPDGKETSYATCQPESLSSCRSVGSVTRKRYSTEGTTIVSRRVWDTPCELHHSGDVASVQRTNVRWNRQCCLSTACVCMFSQLFFSGFTNSSHLPVYALLSLTIGLESAD